MGLEKTLSNIYYLNVSAFFVIKKKLLFLLTVKRNQQLGEF
jgi:hypothetical protein